MALDRYLRARSRHRHAHLPNLWLARDGALTRPGLQKLLERRCAAARLDKIHHTSSGTPDLSEPSKSLEEREQPLVAPSRVSHRTCRPAVSLGEKEWIDATSPWAPTLTAVAVPPFFVIDQTRKTHSFP